jgi:hypothetical protein
MTESAGRARLITRIEMVILNARQDCKVNPQFAGGLEPVIELLSDALAAEALAGQEEAPQQKDDEEEDHARGVSVPGTHRWDLPRRSDGDK